MDDTDVNAHQDGQELSHRQMDGPGLSNGQVPKGLSQWVVGKLWESAQILSNGQVVHALSNGLGVQAM